MTACFLGLQGVEPPPIAIAYLGVLPREPAFERSHLQDRGYVPGYVIPAMVGGFSRSRVSPAAR